MRWLLQFLVFSIIIGAAAVAGARNATMFDNNNDAVTDDQQVSEGGDQNG